MDDEEYDSYYYNDHYCDATTYSVFDAIFTDAQFEPIFHSSNHHIDVPIQGPDDNTPLFNIFISGEHENEQVGTNADEAVHVAGPGPVTLDEEDDESFTLGRLLRDGIAAVFEHLQRVVEDPYSDLDWKSWGGLFRGRGTQIDVSLNTTVPSTSAAKCGDREEVKGKESVRSEIGAVSCPICMEHWTTDGEHSVCSLPCGHLYGMSCIKRWLQQQDQGKCPQCKKICKLEDVRKIYGPFVATDKHLQEKIRLLEAKCASLELKDSEWEKKEAKWRQKEEELSRKMVNKEKVVDLLDVAEVHA